MKNVKSHTRHSVITAEHLARKMNIRLEKVKQMMIPTKQKGMRTAEHPITRQYRVDHLDLQTYRLAGKGYVEWISAGTKSLYQNAGAFFSPT